MRKFNIILLILWLLTIFLFSNDKAEVSSEKSDGISNTIVNIIENISGNNYSEEKYEEVLNIVIFIVRKTAHFLEYLILGLLVINVIKDYKVLEVKYIITGVLFCMLYAISDEIHQLFVSGRSCQIKDILIDTTGSITGILIYYLLYKHRKNKLNK